MTFFVGQKVVCIDGSFTDPRWKDFLACGIRLPQENTVYTIRRLFPALTWSDNCVAGGIHLAEIINPELHLFIEPPEIPFCLQRFRPLVERKSKTDISFALDILDKANRTITEKV